MLIKAEDEAYVPDLPVDAAKVKAEINLIAIKTKGSKDTTDIRLMHLYSHKNKHGPISDLQQRPIQLPRLMSDLQLRPIQLPSPMSDILQRPVRLPR